MPWFKKTRRPKPVRAGDLDVAEPGALIGFAGPRLIELRHPGG